MLKKYFPSVLIAITPLITTCSNAERLSSPSSALSSIPPAFNTTKTCKPWSTMKLKDTLLSNNIWGVRKEIGSQCISTINTQDYAWSWEWENDTDHIITFPSITFGFKPWGDSSTTPVLPQHISNIQSIPIAFHFNQHAIGRQNLLLEAWLTDPTKVISKDTIKREIGIHFFQNGWLGQAGKFVDAINIDNINYDVYFSKPWHSKRGNFHWEYISIIRKTPLPNPANIQLDFKQFLNALVELGLSSNHLTLASLELGTEVINGKGHASISGLNISIEQSDTKN